MSTQAFESGSQEEAYITQEATSLGLDPKAVLAVASVEGITLPSEPGDPAGNVLNAHSFGPWQLNYQGALPSEVWAQGPQFAQAWANSPAGINNALTQVHNTLVGQGQPLQGPGAVAAQVQYFERPTDIPGEIQSAQAAYAAGKGPTVSSGGGFMSDVSNIAGTAVNIGLGALTFIPGVNAHSIGLGGGTESPQQEGLQAAAKPVSSTLGFLQDLSNPNFWIRVAEVLGGAILVGLGLYLVLKDFGVSVPKPPGPMGRAADELEGLKLEASRQQAQARIAEGQQRQATAAARQQYLPQTTQQRYYRARAQTRTARAEARTAEAGVPKVETPRVIIP